MQLFTMTGSGPGSSSRQEAAAADGAFRTNSASSEETSTNEYAGQDDFAGAFQRQGEASGNENASGSGQDEAPGGSRKPEKSSNEDPAEEAVFAGLADPSAAAKVRGSVGAMNEGGDGAAERLAASGKKSDAALLKADGSGLDAAMDAQGEEDSQLDLFEHSKEISRPTTAKSGASGALASGAASSSIDNTSLKISDVAAADFGADAAQGSRDASAASSRDPGAAALRLSTARGNEAGVVSQMIAAVRTGISGDSVEVRLDPPELGRIRMDFDIDGVDTVKVIVTAERGETLDYLRRHVSDLEQSLKQAGFESVTLGFAGGEERSFDAFRAGVGANEMGDDVAETAESGAVTYLTLRESAQLDLLV